MILNAMEIEGHVVNRSHMFKDVVENGNYISSNKEGAEIPRSSWNEQKKKRYLLNSKVINSLMCALMELKYEKFHSCKLSKEIWDTLALA
ncbi:hypothetical protein CR513_30126, partial [Mucuna pruriens]